MCNKSLKLEVSFIWSFIQVRKLLEKYWPWGRPGGGAPNKEYVGLKNVELEGMYSEEDMKRVRYT